ncbi:hypothetical protein PFISCL1PPCAC_7330 [Pristionchus fissidentatus]|uniref:F-box domain-containing protein n=1 Tax=Pristionchus fissidentatus TaxID=1538716 RepID=A0AAV5VCW2_9BILA|nr:hypothetical protein PFISCL1PPCAC_7330 [Pristionchus fissidentatus]
MATLETYPDIVIQEIAMRLDYNTMRTMKLVHSRFHTALSDPLMWIHLCEKDKRTLPSYDFRKSLAEKAREDKNFTGQLDFEHIWAKDPFRQNHAPPLLPSIAEMETSYRWRINPLSDTSIIMEEPPVGCAPHPAVKRCFSTREAWCIRPVTINLVKEGVPEWLLDHVRPRIIITELIALHTQYSNNYHMHTCLLRDGEQVDEFVPQARNREVKRERRADGLNVGQQAPLADWEQVDIVFEDYPVGMRRIEMKIYHSGTTFANLRIRLEMPNILSRWLGANEFPDVTYRDCCGIRVLRTEYDRYISVDGETLFQSDRPYHWIIEDHDGKVSLQTEEAPVRFLRCDHELVSIGHECTDTAMWRLVENADGSWALKTDNNWYLTSFDRSVSTMPHNLLAEHFWIDRCEEKEEES